MSTLAERSAEITVEIERLKTELIEAESAAVEECQRIAADALTHVIPTAEAGKRTAAVERDLDKRRSRLSELELALPELARRQRVEEEQARERDLAAARKRVGEADGSLAKAGKNLARDLRAVISTIQEVERLRELLKQALAAERELLARGEQGTTVADEQWEIPQDVLDVLVAGPLRAGVWAASGHRREAGAVGRASVLAHAASRCWSPPTSSPSRNGRTCARSKARSSASSSSMLGSAWAR